MWEHSGQSTQLQRSSCFKTSCSKILPNGIYKKGYFLCFRILLCNFCNPPRLAHYTGTTHLAVKNGKTWTHTCITNLPQPKSTSKLLLLVQPVGLAPLLYTPGNYLGLLGLKTTKPPKWLSIYKTHICLPLESNLNIIALLSIPACKVESAFEVHVLFYQNQRCKQESAEINLL